MDRIFAILVILILGYYLYLLKKSNEAIEANDKRLNLLFKMLLEKKVIELEFPKSEKINEPEKVEPTIVTE